MASRKVAIDQLADRGYLRADAENFLTAAEVAGARIARGVAVTYSDRAGFRVRSSRAARARSARIMSRGGDTA